MSDLTSFSATVDISAYRGATKLAKLAKGAGRNAYLKMHVSAGENLLTMVATDLDLTVATSIPATVSIPGGMFVDGAWTFGNIPKGRGTVDVVGNETSWSLRNGVTATGPGTIIADVWMGNAAPVETFAFTIPAAVMSAAVEVAGAASRDECRPILTAVYFDGFNVVATDSYRLHAVNHGCDPGPLTGCLVPLRVILAADAIGATTVAVSVDGRRVTFRGPGGIVTGRLVEGSFPKWQSLRADRKDLVGELLFADRAAVLHILGDMARVSKSSSGSAPVRITRGAIGSLELAVHVDGSPAISATVAGDMTGADLLGFSPTYLRGILEETGSGPATLRGKSQTHPWELAWHDEECAEHFRLLMPVRIA
jgi:DNA polymerase III sliding clamp (beta) subunit (PCNA family)